jgi:2-succinyl-5-enolpyruvyl-6-hydroxy-3-cyclohexene-1-carboxylate synthase
MPLPLGVQPADESWLNSWKSADADIDELDTDDFVSRNVVHTVLELAGPGDLVWIAASMAVRYADDVATLRPDAPMMLVNRGTNGIDGLIASAGGAALAHPQGRTFLIIGDVAFLHDLSSLAIPILEKKPPLTIVVLNNRGGAIFKTLEQGDPRFENVFDRVYGTHHDFDITATAAALGYPAKNVDSIADLKKELDQHPRVIVASLYNN